MVLVLDYQSCGFPIDSINIHSLQSGSANALSLAGYSNRQIQKMGHWKASTFKDYIREEQQVFSQGMSRDMEKHFRFINISSDAYHKVTDMVNAMEYTVNATAA